MLKPQTKQPATEKPLVQALQRGKLQRVPFWFMRQAGRYLPEYRALRQKAGSFLDLCFSPELAAEVTLQPVRRFGMDAAILFSDILVIPYALGQTLDFAEGEGPQLGALDIAALSFDAAKLAPVHETLLRARAQLAPEKALIGFAGAPWTVACYMVEGRGDAQFNKTKAFAYEKPAAFDGLIDVITAATVSYLAEQVKNGADAVQLFDSWAGLLPEPYFTRWAVNPAARIRAALKADFPGVPVIGFPRGAGALYPSYAQKTGVDGLGLDTQVPLPWALRECGDEVCLQGNLDPALVLAGGNALEQAALEMLYAAKGRPFIFNLGHGILKETPPGHVARLCEIIRGFAA